MIPCTICPKELITGNNLYAQNLNKFEEEKILPLIEIIEECERCGVGLVTSANLLALISEKMPWQESTNPEVQSFLNTWYRSIIGPLSKFATSDTLGEAAIFNCDLIDHDLNNHFKQMIADVGGTVKRTIGQKQHFGIHVQNDCPDNEDCGKNIYVVDTEAIQILRYPWRTIYPKELPCEGDYPFTPPIGWEKQVTPKRSIAGGYLDQNGHSWERDKLHKNHWDVQLGGTGNYNNVSFNGKIL
jgi:hypothetical protein